MLKTFELFIFELLIMDEYSIKFSIELIILSTNFEHFLPTFYTIFIFFQYQKTLQLLNFKFQRFHEHILKLIQVEALPQSFQLFFQR